MTDTAPAQRLTDRVRQELHERAATPDRLTSVVSACVPSPVPGLVLLGIAQGSGADSGSLEDAANAVVAVEFAALHQYLHAVPDADALEAPARNSPYAEDDVAAIIDGDWLQAAAFARVAADARSPATARRCYTALAEGSTGCYELRRRAAATDDVQPLAPLVAAAGRVGAIVAGLDREAAATAAAVARAIGESVRVRTPTGTVDGDAAEGPDWTRIHEELADVVPEPGAVADALHPLAGAEPAVETGDRTGAGP